MSLFDLFRCRHRRTTLPMKICGVCSVCCLRCGTRLAYDWETMRRGAVIQPEPYVRAACVPGDNVHVIDIGRRRKPKEVTSAI